MPYNSLIKHKTGICPMCKNGREVPIIKELCHNHYWQMIKLKSYKKRTDGIVRYKDGKTEHDLWFERIMEQEEAVCWNCGERAEWLKDEKWSKVWKGCVAHILPKRENGGFPSVATHPLNYMILFPAMSKICSCHDRYDSNWKNASKMKAFPIAKQRFELFKNDIAKEEVYRIPSIFLTGEIVLKW